MAAVMTMVELMESYTKGRGWKWQECDCIGLLFHCVNYYAPKPQLRVDHLPADLSYTQSCAWLAGQYSSPLTPYIQMMSDAGFTPMAVGGGPSIAVVYGGDPLVSDDQEQYPVHIIPGIVFTTEGGEDYALMVGGLKRVNLTYQSNRKIIRYPLTGVIR